MSNTETYIAGLKLDSYIFNASGVNDSVLEELEIIANSKSSAITMKSCTIEPRKGNKEPRYARTAYGSIQSMGLPNLGYKKYIEFASYFKKYNKPVIASVAGLCIEDYKLLVGAFQKSDADMIEVNISCPNTDNSIFGYDFEAVENILYDISKFKNKPLGLKLPAYLDSSYNKFISKLIRKYNISFITCINSIGGLIINSETESPVIKNRFGGISGNYIKPIALGNVRRLYELLDKKVSIIGVGGISSGQDAFEFLLAGADAVQVATAFEKEGPSCFRRIKNELEEILESKNYKSIGDVKGRREVISSPSLF